VTFYSNVFHSKEWWAKGDGRIKQRLLTPLFVRSTRFANIPEQTDFLFTNLTVRLRLDPREAAKLPKALVWPRSTPVKHAIISVVEQHDQCVSPVPNDGS
jgi:hypothetical protein